MPQIHDRAGAGRRPRLRLLALLPLLLAALLLTGCSHQASRAQAPAAAGHATSGSTPHPKAEAGDGALHAHVHVSPAVRRDLHRGTARYLAALTDGLASPRKHAGPRLGQRITGDALAALHSLRDEYRVNRWHVRGQARLVGSRVIHRYGPGRLLVAACIDNRAVRVLDKHGRPAAHGHGPARSLNLLTLVRHDGHWVVARTTFPNDPRC